MPYEPPPPPAWMPGNEAIEHIRTVKKPITEADAIEQLRTAMVHRAVRGIPADMKRRPFGYTPIMEEEPFPSPEEWRTARIRANGTVQFPREDTWRPFKVRRENVLLVWPKKPAIPRRRSKESRTSTTEIICEALSELWPGDLPKGLKAKERNTKIADWLTKGGHSIPKGNHGLQKAVQRAMRTHATTTSGDI